MAHMKIQHEGLQKSINVFSGWHRNLVLTLALGHVLGNVELLGLRAQNRKRQSEDEDCGMQTLNLTQTPP